MKAAVVASPGVLEYTDVPDPKPFGDRPVRVRVGGVGLCGSDLLRYAHGTAYHYPLVLGHEFSGIVTEAPAGSRFESGDRVAVFPLLPKSDDPFTEVGDWALGSDYDYFGSRRDGGMMEWLWVPERNLVPVPASMPLIVAATVEPAAVALHAVHKLSVPQAGVALVIGAGPIGAFAAQWLRVLGWMRVLVADVDPRKRAIMEQLGFETIAADLGDTVALARAANGGRGVDVAVEASGFPQTFLQCLEVAGPHGQVLVLGDLKGDVTIPRQLISSLIRRELRVLGTWNSKITPAGRSEWDMVVHHLAAGTVQSLPLISQAPALAEVPEFMAAMADRAVWTNKVVIAVAEEAQREVAELGVADKEDEA